MKNAKLDRVKLDKAWDDAMTAIVVSDIHAGSYPGMTHPDCSKLKKSDKELRKIQKDMWDWYSDEVSSLGHIDWLVSNGDAIDGKASKCGGNDLMTTSLSEQVDMAQKVIQHTNADKYLIVRGTEYHTSENGEDFEEILARRCNAKYTLGGSFRFTIGDFTYPVVFNFRHDMKSRAWNTRAGGLKRFLINDIINVAKGDMDLPTDVLIRSHIHVFDFVNGERRNTIAISTPALQARMTTYGQLRCDGQYDVGFIEFKITKDGRWRMIPHLANIPSLVNRVQDI